VRIAPTRKMDEYESLLYFKSSKMKVYVLYSGIKTPWESTRFLPVRGDIIHYTGYRYSVIGLEYFLHSETNEIIEIHILVSSL
jgi:hypothetical protein